eukprot:5845779-Prymnesium_polylepis.1
MAVARQRQISMQVASRCVLIVLERLARKGPADLCRCAWHHQEGEAERHGQHSPQPGCERGTSDVTHCWEIVTIPVAATLNKFGNNKADGKHEYDSQGPDGAHPDAHAVVAQAGGGYHQDALKLRRQLKKVYPLGEVLQAQRWLHIVDTGDRSKALIKAHKYFQLCIAGVPTLEAAADGESATDCGDEDEQHHTHQDNGAGSQVAAVMAASIQLVKEPGVGGPVTQLAPRPTIARFAVAVAVRPRVRATAAGTPPTIRLAAVCLRREF